MSNTYAKLISLPMAGAERFVSDMDVTAYMGGDFGKCVQLTTKNDIVCLSERQISDLIRCLRSRLNNKVTSTGSEELGEFRPQIIHQTNKGKRSA